MAEGNHGKKKGETQERQVAQIASGSDEVGRKEKDRKKEESTAGQEATA
jgi:hypothetical protein